MNKLFLAFLMMPLLMTAQDDVPDMIFQNVILMPQIDKVDEFETHVAAHNKKYHADDTYGCRVYNIGSGADMGKYVWTMGPTTWAALDDRPGSTDDGHDEDWAKVTATLDPSATSGTFWSFDVKNSYFPEDFTIENLYIMWVDVKRGEGGEVARLLEDVKAVYEEKMGNQPYGIYWNQTGSYTDVRDMAVIWFFDSWSWMGEDNGFVEKFEEMFGEDSWERWLDDWRDATVGTGIEIWNYREDLSGLSGEVVASERQ